MPIPTTRDELVEQVTASFGKLVAELDRAGAEAAALPCVDDWSVKDLLAVRLWWTERVADWIEAGRRGEAPTTPAPGYSWRETPRLNADVVAGARNQGYETIRKRLDQGYRRVLKIVGELDDRELLETGVFRWAGSYPISRWISINTARQYTTARAHLRRALRQREAGLSGTED